MNPGIYRKASSGTSQENSYIKSSKLVPVFKPYSFSLSLARLTNSSFLEEKSPIYSIYFAEGFSDKSMNLKRASSIEQGAGKGNLGSAFFLETKF